MRAWRVFGAMVLLALALAGAARADDTFAPVAQSTRFGPFPAMRAEVDYVYTQQSLRAQYLLGWNRGVQYDSYVDWYSGREFVFRPWDHNGWEYAIRMTPGERFAEWWVGYCPINCDKPVTEEMKAQLAADFDAALAEVVY